MLVEKTLERRCPKCGASATMTFEEPEHDTSGKNTRWIDATGCWGILDGKLVHICEEDDA